MSTADELYHNFVLADADACRRVEEPAKDLARLLALVAAQSLRQEPVDPTSDDREQDIEVDIQRLGPDGHLYFADSFGSLSGVRRVYRLAPPFTGEPRPTSISGILPAGLLWDGDRLLVCDTGAHRVRIYDRRLARIDEWPVPAPWNLCRTPHDGYWVVSHTNQAMLLRRGIVIKILPVLLAPFDVAVPADGTLWISEQGEKPGDPGRVLRRSTSGEVLQTLDYPWPNPEGLALDAAGNLAIAEAERGELVEVPTHGTPRVLASALGIPVVVIAIPGGWLVSTSGAGARLLRVTR